MLSGIQSVSSLNNPASTSKETKTTTIRTTTGTGYSPSSDTSPTSSEKTASASQQSTLQLSPAIFETTTSFFVISIINVSSTMLIPPSDKGATSSMLEPAIYLDARSTVTIFVTMSTSSSGSTSSLVSLNILLPICNLLLPFARTSGKYCDDDVFSGYIVVEVTCIDDALLAYGVEPTIDQPARTFPAYCNGSCNIETWRIFPNTFNSLVRQT